jgi:hypothetical protein
MSPSVHRRALRAIVLSMLLASPVPASADAAAQVPSPRAGASSAFPQVQGEWLGDFSIPAFDGPTVAGAVFNQKYFVAGRFDWAAGVPARNVVMWTGSAWTQAGEGLATPVTCLTPAGSKLLAGTTTFVSGVSPVMSFDGASWRPLGAGLFGIVKALLADGAQVYAAGDLLLPDFSTAPRVVVWDGAAWRPLGGTFDNDIHALAIFRGEIYAAGDFLSADGEPASRIARFDGTHWHDVGGGTEPGDFNGQPTVAALAVLGDRLYAGGSFKNMGGTGARGLAAWDGAAWHGLPNTPADAQIRDLAVDGGLLQIAGLLQVPNQWSAGLVTFDGTNWVPPSPTPTWGVEDLAVGDGALLAVGQMDGFWSALSPFVEPARNVVVRDPQWRGLAPWQPGMRGLMGPYWTQVSALQLHHGEIYAGGYFLRAAHPPDWVLTEGIARWDGDAWQPLAGGFSGWVYEMTTWDDRLVAGGPFIHSPDAGTSSVLAWDGNRWSAVGGRIEGYVNALTAWGDALVVARQLGSAEQPAPPLAVSRGGPWEYFGSELLANHGAINELVPFGGDLVVLGSGLSVPGAPSRGVAAWDGQTWRALPGAPLLWFACALARADGLWVGGDSFAGPGANGSNVWRWDGSSWSPIGAVSGFVRRLAETPAGVYAAGSLYVNGQATSLARFTDGAWQVVPDAPQGYVGTLAALGAELFVGGAFTVAGNRQAEAIARWVDHSAPPPHATLAPPQPTPSRDQATFRFTLANGGRVRLRIYDLHGALVAEPVDEFLSPGAYERTWAFASSPQRVRAGIYFARLTTNRGTATTRVVIAP